MVIGTVGFAKGAKDGLFAWPILTNFRLFVYLPTDWTDIRLHREVFSIYLSRKLFSQIG